MSYSAELVAIESRFHNAWAMQTPVAYAGADFTPPDNLPWVRLSVLPGQSNAVSMGSAPLYRHPGIIDVVVFVPLAYTHKQAMALVDAVAAIFRGAIFSGIVCRAPDVFVVGNAEGWYQVNVTIGFHRDETF